MITNLDNLLYSSVYFYGFCSPNFIIKQNGYVYIFLLNRLKVSTENRTYTCEQGPDVVHWFPGTPRGTV